MNSCHHSRTAILQDIVYAGTRFEMEAVLEHERFTLETLIETEAPLSERLMVASDDQAIYYVFRGTSNKTQWKSNCNTFSKRLRFPAREERPFVKVHRGFCAGYEALLEHIDQVPTPPKGKAVIIAGHSRGAAIALIAALMLQHYRDWQIDEVHLMGCPRTFKRKDVRWIEKQLPIVNWLANNDTVGRVPPAISGYRHVLPRAYFDSSDHLHLNPSFWRLAKGQVVGRAKGGLFDGLSDHASAGEYRRLVFAAPQIEC